MTKSHIANNLLAAGFALYAAGLAAKIYYDPLIFSGAKYKASLTEAQRADYKKYANYGTAANIFSFVPLGIITLRKMSK